MIDTSALIAALVRDHEHHARARPHLLAETIVPAIVLAESYAQLRRTFGQSAASASALLRHWSSTAERIAATTAEVVRDLFGRSVEFDLGGNIHDALVRQRARPTGCRSSRSTVASTRWPSRSA